MTMIDWLIKSPENLIGVLVSTIGYYLLMILISRLFGPRSFTTMSGFDFIVTLSMGALLASTIVSKEITLAEGIVALITLFMLQWLIALIRVKLGRKFWIDHPPVLLMDGPLFLEENMRKARITRNELIAKLREHNINNYEQINAVVFESSGTISVLHKLNYDHPLDKSLLSGVDTGQGN